ncbi:hypothetical protein JZ751_009209 [Albula glossodonta]|uniref:Sonic hedgehog n=1 Tax=Albula glossodonta TaxID=121402 RepID=A0A8T2N2C9_9TELE|nr:hypothetical protein JZ751_009209 [Albula glossodonta]
MQSQRYRFLEMINSVAPLCSRRLETPIAASRPVSRSDPADFLREHSVAAKTGGCFPGGGLVTLEGGRRKAVQDLRPGDRVLASPDSDSSGKLVYSEVINFIHHDPTTRKHFYTIRTEEGAELALTAAHLLFVTEGKGNCSGRQGGAMQTAFASEVRPGQCVLTARGEWGPQGRLSRVVGVGLREDRGAFAPLTQHGTLVVDGVLASCYAAVDQHRLAHWAFAPLRLLYSWAGPAHSSPGDGIHWYSRALYWAGTWLLHSDHFHPWGMAESER